MKREDATVLAVGGIDSGACAGLFADAQAIKAMGARPRLAVAALTAQSDEGLYRIEPSPLAQFVAEIEISFEEGHPAAVKTGMLADAEHLNALLGVLDGIRFSGALIVDPVHATSSGAPLWDEAGWQALQSALLPKATLITPNRSEAERLLATSTPSAAHAANALRERFGVSVLVKGGHFPEEPIHDALVIADRHDIVTFIHPRQRWQGATARGTGCRLASAIAALLARGWDLIEACRMAIEWLGDGPVEIATCTPEKV